MSRIDELDRKPFEVGQRVAIKRIAEWWDERLGPKQSTRAEFFAFLRETFGFVAKRCNTCKAWKADYDFPLSKNCKDGRLGYCRACEAKKEAEYRLRNLERARAKQREWYHANRERVSWYRQQWRQRRAKRANAPVS